MASHHMINPYLKRNKKFEKSLFSLLPDKFHNRFKRRISSNKSGYWQTISEMRTIVLFHKLGISPKKLDAKTVKDKDVDFVFEYNEEKIYVEVKGLRPENCQTTKKTGSFGAGEEKIERALRRASKKFFENAYNIVVIADEETTKTSLFGNPLLKNQSPLSLILSLIDLVKNVDYGKISALIILGGFYEKQLFQFKIWYNPNARKDLPQGLKTIFDQNKVKKDGRETT